jgi:hypothetical protein
MFFAFKNGITEHTSQSSGLVIDMVLYKALWHSNEFTQWLGNHWGFGKASDDSSRPSKASGQWPVQAGCAQGSDFKKYLRTSFPYQIVEMGLKEYKLRWRSAWHDSVI